MDQLLLLIRDLETRRQLAEQLTRDFALVESQSAATPALCLVDLPALERQGPRLRELRDRQAPVFLPVLLVLEPADRVLAAGHLQGGADELITLPVDPAELDVRVRLLMRTRELSRRLATDTPAALQEQAARLASQEKARLAALNLLEDAMTERRRAEAARAALAESERSFRLLTEQVPAIIYRAALNATSETLYVSPRVADLGYSQEQWLADPDAWARALHPQDRERVFRELDDWRQRGGPLALEYRLRDKDGQWRDFQDLGEIIRDQAGQPLYLQGLMIDVSERRRTEAQLMQLALAVEQSPESIVITDTDGQIGYVNAAFVATTGYRREEVLGRNPRLLQSGRTPAETYRSLWSSLHCGEAWKGEFINRRKDGSEYVEFAIVTPLRQPDGAISHYVAVKEDITEKKRIGAELDGYRHHLEQLIDQRTAQLEEARQRAEAASRAKSAFLANMSHEIRTPMNAIVGLAHLLQRQAGDPVERERLDKIVAAAHHLLSLINDILDLSKIEAGKLSLEIAEFDLTQVLENVAALVAERAQARGLDLLIDIDPPLAQAPLLLGDATRLRQALLNYAGNAVKFTEQGSITLRARLIEAGAADLVLRFEVQDTGIGIAPEDQPRLFRSFEQLDATISRSHGGTGLGLAINRHLAELMGGEVGVESSPGAGSLFWMTARLDKSGRTAHPWASGLLRGRRALLVDGSPGAQGVLRRMLQTLGLHVEAVATVEAALAAIVLADSDGVPIDFALFDWQTADLLKHRLERDLGTLPLGRWAPRLIALVPDLPGLRETAAGIGLSHQLIKPVTLSSLHDLLARLVQDLPAERAGQEADSQEQALQRRVRDRGAIRVLLVEDNPINQEVARDLLAEAGLAVDLAGDGAQALALAGRQRYDAILMDMQMPVMDGIEATRRIRALPAGGDLPILAMTANAFGEDRQRCLEAGMNDYIAKPVDPENLFATLLRWLPLPAAPGNPRAPRPAGGPPDDRTWHRLAGIAGLDAGNGLRNVGGQLGRFLRLLEHFARDHGGDGCRLREMVAGADREGAARLAHGLKGVAATLGLGTIAEGAAALEAALRDGSGPEAALAHIDRALDAFTGSWQRAFPPGPEVDDGDGEAPDLPPDVLLEQLENLLAHDDGAVNQVFAAALARLRPAAGADLEPIGQRIEAFDYPTALALVRQLRRRLAGAAG